MADEPKYPHLETLSDSESYLLRRHQVVQAILQEASDPLLGCGEVWCSGSCRLPALVLPAYQHPSYGAQAETRLVGNMVARGNVMQEFRRPWKGKRIILPSELRAILETLVWT